MVYSSATLSIVGSEEKRVGYFKGKLGYSLGLA
jgi:hypothetical protein